MKRITYCLLFLLVLCGCNNEKDRSDTTSSSENEVDAARNFIRLALDGKWDNARKMVIADSLNLAYLDIAAQNYKQRMDLSTRIAYRKASIRVLSVEEHSDSMSVVHYANSYKQQEDSLKVVRRNGQYFIDLKYSFPATQPMP